MSSIFDRNNISKAEKSKNKKKYTIMIVDDEPQQLVSMQSLLADDYNVITAQSAPEALEKIESMENPTETLSVIISDQKMPGMTGIDLFKEILSKKMIPHTPRIIITGWEDKGTAIEALDKARIHQFIFKSYDPDDFKQRIKQE